MPELDARCLGRDRSPVPPPFDGAAVVAVRFLVRLKTEPPDESFLQCGRARVVEERPCDEAQQKRGPEVGVGGAAALDELLEHSARILPDFVQHRRLLDTGDAAERSAFFDDGVLPFDVLVRVVGERDARHDGMPFRSQSPAYNRPLPRLRRPY